MGRKISPTLSKLLSDVQVPNDEEIVEINNGITEDVIALEESNQDAIELLEGIEETTAAITDIETVGLQKDVDLTAVKLLANSLKHAVNKLDSNFKVELAGLQNDNQESFLKDTLEEAKGILAVAKDELEKTMKTMSEKVISLDGKIEDMKKYVIAKEETAAEESDKKTETIEAIAELIESVKNTSEEVNNSEAVETEVPAEATTAMDNISENLDTIKEEVAPETEGGESTEEIDNVDKDDGEEK